MKLLYFRILIFAAALSFQSVFSQNDFAEIRKNVNSRASSLNHNLNKTKDTLVLKSPKKISYVYSINSKYKREIDAYVGAKEHLVPLTNLSHGKHVFVVSHQRMKIVFTIFINGDKSILIPKSEKVVTSNKDD